MLQPLWKTVWRFLKKQNKTKQTKKKLGIEPLFAPAVPLLCIYPKETKIERDTSIPTPMHIP